MENNTSNFNSSNDNFKAPNPPSEFNNSKISNSNRSGLTGRLQDAKPNKYKFPSSYSSSKNLFKNDKITENFQFKKPTKPKSIIRSDSFDRYVAQPILNDEYNLLGNMLTNSLNLGQNANIANDPDLQEMSAGLDRWSGADQVNSILTFGSTTRATSNLRNRPNDWGGIALQAGILRIPTRRNIPLVPDRILDAPGLDDDYYSNLMAWSERNELAIGLGDTAFLWNAENSNVESLDSGEPSTNICSVSWSQAGDHLAVGREDGTTQIWDAATKQLLRTMYAPQTDTAYDPSTITNFNRVGALSWNNHILTSGHRSRIVCNHDVRQKDHLVKTLREHDGEVCGLTWRSDGQCLASGGNDNRVNVWDIRSDIPFRTTVIHKAAVKALAWCPWKLPVLATGGGSQCGKVFFTNVTTGDVLKEIDTKSQVTSIIWNSNHEEVLTTHGHPANRINIWSYPTGHKLAGIDAHDSRILAACIDPSKETLATVSSDETVKFWKLFGKEPSASENPEIHAPRVRHTPSEVRALGKIFCPPDRQSGINGRRYIR